MQVLVQAAHGKEKESVSMGGRGSHHDILTFDTRVSVPSPVRRSVHVAGAEEYYERQDLLDSWEKTGTIIVQQMKERERREREDRQIDEKVSREVDRDR